MSLNFLGSDYSSRNLRSGTKEDSSEDEANGHCSLVTGGECFIFDCNDSRGGSTKVDCVEGYCLCKVGYCNVNGACVRGVVNDTSDDLWTPVHQAMRWATHPEECVFTTDGYARLYPCGATPQQFVLPIGLTGQIEIKDTDLCMSIINDTTYVGAMPCNKGDLRQEWDMPNGGTGLIRSNHQRDMCIEVQGGSVLPGVPLVISPCSSKNLDEQFGDSFEPPPSHLGCTTAAGCSMLKNMAVSAYCSVMPSQPWCQGLKQCPPGGCHNGECVEGKCVCNLGFTGPTCEDGTSGPVPMNYPDGFTSAVANEYVVFPRASSPGPAPAPAPAAPASAPVAAPAAVR